MQNNRIEIHGIITQKLVKELNLLFKSIQIGELNYLAECIEQIVITQVKSTLTECSLYWVANNKIKVEKLFNGKIKINNTDYKISVTEKVMDESVLLIAIFPQLPQELSIPQPIKIDINSILGKYNSIELLIHDQSNLFNIKSIQELIILNIKTSYAWLNEKIIDILSSEQTHLASNIYRFLRTLIPQNELSESVWFAHIIEDYACWVIDYRLKEYATKKLKEISKGVNDSPAKLLANYLTVMLEAKLSNATKLDKVGSPKDFHIPSSQISKHDYLLGLSHIAIFNSEHYTFFPVILESNYILFCIYPIEKKDIITEKLLIGLPELIEIGKSNKNNTRRLISKLKNQKVRINYGQIGELIGGIIKPIITN